MSAQAECAEACVLLGDATHAAVLYERLLPYAGRPATAGRAVTSYGAVDRHLGGLAALLGRRDDAVRHLRAAIARNDELGCTVWRLPRPMVAAADRAGRPRRRSAQPLRTTLSRPAVGFTASSKAAWVSATGKTSVM